MPYPINIREEELKNKVGFDFFNDFDWTTILRDIDFSVKVKGSQLNEAYFLWAEAKAKPTEIEVMLTQLILTIGKARTFNRILPPAFLGCFDNEKIAFIHYHDIQNIFYKNDINWNVTPSDHTTEEFKQIIVRTGRALSTEMKKNWLADGSGGQGTPSPYIFYFDKDNAELKKFIKQNFVLNNVNTHKIQIDKNNFITIYTKWLEKVKPTILLSNWEEAKKQGIIDADFYLADLLSENNQSIKESLFVVLKDYRYELDRHTTNLGAISTTEVSFRDGQKKHKEFWAIYERPPREEYWDYIIGRRDLLVPQDVRERKGSFYTPKIWVELSQKYIADTLGEDWQEEYYIWDCAAGTGNLLAGLTNKYKIFASTLDKADVDVIHDRIKNGANLLPDNVFQFDFLNDSFDKLPAQLKKIIDDPEKRKKLVIYINPPYAEAAQYGKSKSGVSSTKTYTVFKDIISFAVNELFSQFFARIYKDIPNCKLASFSTLKYVVAQNFSKFRAFFQAQYLKGFVCRANTFDNVTGNFPIGFLIWDLNHKKPITDIECDVIDNKGDIEGIKKFFAVSKGELINDWLRKFYDKKDTIGYLRFVGPDFQANSGVYITNGPKESDIKESRIQTISHRNLLVMTVYISVRKCIEATWLNDRDQFLSPQICSDEACLVHQNIAEVDIILPPLSPLIEGGSPVRTHYCWEHDLIFQSDCLAYTLFHSSNNIQCRHGVNHWIPFSEDEVGAHSEFESHFMYDFINNNVRTGRALSSAEKTSDSPQQLLLIDTHDCRDENRVTARVTPTGGQPIVFSPEAQAVFDIGREIWRYYHSKKPDDYNVNASLYDIRAYFQGKDDKGRMKSSSIDDVYNGLMADLRAAMKVLAAKIEPKVYEYGFLKR